MAETPPQTYRNHAKLVPSFHYVVLPIFLANLLLALYRMFTVFSLTAAWGVALAIGLLMVAIFARVFALGAQDRVIRLEERLRMQGLLPNELKPHIDEFTMDQLAALRFASDEELPNLTKKVVDDSIADRKTIKQMIVTWRADNQRL
jgi:hypothetical protein